MNGGSGISWPAAFGNPSNAKESTKQLCVDSTGNVCVTGQVSSAGPKTVMFVRRYDVSGNLLWEQQHGNTLYQNYGVAVATNGSDVYAAGATGGANGLDYFVVKYNYLGAVQWSKNYDNPFQHGDDIPVAIGFDSTGAVYVTGTSAGQGTGNDIMTMKFAGTDGAVVWQARFNRAGVSQADVAADMEVYPGIGGESGESGKVVVTGSSYGGTSSGDDFVTIAYEIDATQPLDHPPTWWTHDLGSGNGAGQDFATSLKLVSSLGAVFVTGYGWNPDTSSVDYATIRYDLNTGAREWAEATYMDGVGHGEDYARKVDAALHFVNEEIQYFVFVTGGSEGASGQGMNAVTQSYDATDGSIAWTSSFDNNSSSNLEDRAVDLIAVHKQDVYVLCLSENGSNPDFVTIRYKWDNSAYAWGSTCTLTQTPRHNGGIQDIPIALGLNPPSSTNDPDPLIFGFGRSPSPTSATPVYKIISYRQE